MRRLTATQRTAVRSIHDGTATEGAGVRADTMRVLRRQGVVTPVGARAVELTAYGQRVYDAIMRTGDGPEDLKEKLWFGGRR